MNLSRLAAEHIDEVFLNTSHFAEEVLLYVGGKESSASKVTGIVTWSPTRADNSGGRAIVRTGELLLSDSVSVSVSDAFRIEGNRAEVTSVGPIQDGARVVYIKQKITNQRGGSPADPGGV